MPLRLVFAAIAIAYAGAAAGDDELDAAFDRDVLVVVANEDACHRFDIYLALTRDQQRRGLMFVRDLPRSTGMLFVYDREQRLSMWMKNTFIPLDIAFAHSNGVIENVARGTQPQSLSTIPSAAPVQFVLELNAGVADALSIGAGSRILWGPIFDTPAGER